MLITLAWMVKGRVVFSSLLAEGVGRETRARIATRTGNNILQLWFIQHHCKKGFVILTIVFVPLQ